MKILSTSLLFGAAMSSVAVAGPRNADKASLTVTSSAFSANEMIPSEYTCDGANISPPLSWTKPPPATKSVAVMVQDPDAPKGPFMHWMLTGVSPEMTSLSPDASLPAGAMAAKNGKGTTGYTGPCPPSGKHHYVFTVYALDLPPGQKITKAELSGSHVLAQGQLIGLYEKQK